MLLITLRIYAKSHQNPGLILLFIICTATFYIIFYNVFSLEAALKLWLQEHYPAVRSLSVAAAVVLAVIPIGILYRVQGNGFADPPQVVDAAVITRIPAVDAAATPTVTPKLEPANSRNPDATAVVKDIRYSSGPTSTTVTIDLDGQVQYEVHRLAAPDRIYVDLRSAKLDRALWDRKFQIQDPLLRKIRIGEHESQVTRATLETTRLCEYSISFVPSLHRLLIELHQSPE